MDKEGEILPIVIILILFFLGIFLILEFGGFKNLFSSLNKKYQEYRESLTKREEKIEEKVSEERLLSKIKSSYELKDFKLLRELASEFLSRFSESEERVFVYYFVGMSFYEEEDKRADELIRKTFFNFEKLPLDYRLNVIKSLGYIYKKDERFDPLLFGYMEKIMRENNILDDELLYLIGYQCIFAKFYDKALYYFTKSSLNDSFIGLARVYVEKGDYSNAIESYLKYFEKSKPVYSNNKYDVVKTAFLKQCLYYANKLFDAKKYEEALKYYKYVYELFPLENQADEAFVRSGAIYLEQKEFEKALFYFEKALKNQSSYSDEEATYLYAITFYCLGKKREAYKYFSIFMNKFPASEKIVEVRDWIDILRKEIGIAN